MAQRTLEVLESLMSGHEMTPGELDNLVSDKVPEDAHLEYKHGDVLKDKKKAARMLREYVAAFANGAGGILIVGVNAPQDQPWAITGCTAPGGGDLREWASRCLTPIAPYLSPPPCLHVVQNPQGDVLVIAADRSAGLVPCVERDRKLIYYLRIHDQTLPAPDYLVSDLMLGRRRYPYLHITDLKLQHSKSRTVLPDALELDFSLLFTVENEGLSWAESVRLGMVRWTRCATNRPTNHLLSYIEVQTRDEQGGSDICALDHVVSHGSRATMNMEPFSFFDFDTDLVTVPLRTNQYWYTPYTWEAAIYLLSEGAPPVWYQLSLTVNSDLLEFIKQGHTELSSGSQLLQIKRVAGARLVVAWNRTG
jgi:hypothetical protein